MRGKQCAAAVVARAARSSVVVSYFTFNQRAEVRYWYGLDFHYMWRSPQRKPLDTHTSQDSSTCPLDIPEHLVAR